MDINEQIATPAVISKVTTMADGSIRLQVDTQEIPPEDKTRVFSLFGKLGYFFFAETTTFKIPDKLPEIQLEKGQKSPSERLRGVLFVYWEQNKIKEDFDTFYRRTMNRYIDSIKEKLV